MAIKTKQKYIESLRQLKPTVYMFGEKIEKPVDNPRIFAGINATGERPGLRKVEGDISEVSLPPAESEGG